MSHMRDRVTAFTLLTHLKEQADRKVLRVSPPYSTRERQDAFIAGYDACLGDIARGELDTAALERERS